MIINKILYFILFIISVVFYILYSKPLSFYILIFIVLFPVFLGICIISAKFLISAALEPKSETALEKNKMDFILKIRNKTLLPFANSIVTIEYFNSLADIGESMTISVPIHSMCSEKIIFSLISEHCGTINVRMKSIIIYDFIKLFSVKIKSENSCIVSVLPEIYPVSDGGMFNTIFSQDSDIFSNHKSGDDPSEIFAFKDYTEGDKLNRIHWKLSTKYDNLIVKHYSMPVNSSILIMLDFCGSCNTEKLNIFDTAASAAFSAAFFLIENKIPFSFAYHCKKENDVKIINISDVVSISSIFTEIFNQEPCEETDFSSKVTQIEQLYSKIIFISTSAENAAEIVNLNKENVISVHLIKDDNMFQMFDSDKNNEIHVINARNPEMGIAEILI